MLDVVRAADEPSVRGADQCGVSRWSNEHNVLAGIDQIGNYTEFAALRRKELPHDLHLRKILRDPRRTFVDQVARDRLFRRVGRFERGRSQEAQ